MAPPVVAFSRHTLVFALVFAPRIFLRRWLRTLQGAVKRLVQSAARPVLGAGPAAQLAEYFDTPFPHLLLGCHQNALVGRHWSLWQESFVELFRYLYKRDCLEVRDFTRFLVALPQLGSSIVARHVAVGRGKRSRLPFEAYWFLAKGDADRHAAPAGPPDAARDAPGPTAVLLYLHGTTGSTCPLPDT